MAGALDDAVSEDHELASAMEELQRVQERVAKLREQTRAKAIADVVEKIRMYEIKPEELGFGSAAARLNTPRKSRLSSSAKHEALGGGVPTMIENAAVDGRSHVKAKYRGPEGQAWAGRGKPPKWLQQLLEAGAKKEDFLVKSGDVANNKE